MELQRSSDNGGFESNFESNIKSVLVYFRLISSLIKFQSNFGKLAIK